MLKGKKMKERQAAITKSAALFGELYSNAQVRISMQKLDEIKISQDIFERKKNELTYEDAKELENLLINYSSLAMSKDMDDDMFDDMLEEVNTILNRERDPKKINVARDNYRRLIEGIRKGKVQVIIPKDQIKDVCSQMSKFEIEYLNIANSNGKKSQKLANSILKEIERKVRTARSVEEVRVQVKEIIHNNRVESIEEIKVVLEKKIKGIDSYLAICDPIIESFRLNISEMERKSKNLRPEKDDNRKRTSDLQPSDGDLDMMSEEEYEDFESNNERLNEIKRENDLYRGRIETFNKYLKTFEQLKIALINMLDRGLTKREMKPIDRKLRGKLGRLFQKKRIDKLNEKLARIQNSGILNFGEGVNRIESDDKQAPAKNRSDRERVDTRDVRERERSIRLKQEDNENK